MSRAVLLVKKSSLFALRLQCGTLLHKGGALPPGSIRNWGGREYVKIGPGDWRLKRVPGKEPWDSSSRKAAELKISDFGTPDEVREMAVMPRLAKTKVDARLIMEEIQNRGPMGNRAIPTLWVVLSKTSINKMLNNKAKNQSFDEEAHLLAAVNLDKLFFNAMEPWKFEINPRKPNVQLVDRRFFYSPMEFKGRIVPVKMTILEFQNKDVNLYSMEAIDVVIK
jgi:hypothetical protein